MVFFADHAAGSNVGVAPPSSWHIEYLASSGAWQSVANSNAYPTAVTDSPAEVDFATVTTTSIRAILNASCSGNQCAGVAVKEWQALAPTAQ